MNSNIKLISNEEQGIGFLKKMYKTMAVLGVVSYSIYQNQYASQVLKDNILSYITWPNFLKSCAIFISSLIYAIKFKKKEEDNLVLYYGQANKDIVKASGLEKFKI